MLWRSHIPCKLIGIPADGPWCFDNFTIVSNRGDLRNIKILQTLLDCKSVPSKCQSTLQATKWTALRFRAGESEAVGQVTPHGFPEFILFVLTYDSEPIVVRLIAHIVAINITLVCPLPPSIVCSATASSSPTLEAISMSAHFNGQLSAHRTFLPRFPILYS